MKNYLKYSLWLTLTVLFALIGMHWPPAITIDGHTMRRVDLLSDVRMSEPDKDKAEAGSLPPVPVVKPAFVDTCRSGMTCTEDYSGSTMRGMTPLYRTLDEIQSKGRLVRIAVSGDFFIEADILTVGLREMLQKRSGECGVGFVTITSMTSGYHPTVRHSFGRWSSHTATDSVYFDKKKQGVFGHYLVPREGACVEPRGQNKYASLLDTCQTVSIFFYNKDEVNLSVRVDRGETDTREFPSTGSLQQMKINGRTDSVRWGINQADSTLFYGLAMDGTQEIIVDNFSLRGSSGPSLRSIPSEMLQEFDAQRSYDLITLKYGLNVVTERGRNYDPYKKSLLMVISHLKECFPQSGSLLLSVDDRDYKADTGESRMIPGVKNLIRYRQSIAAENGTTFWNTFETMGGDGSTAGLVHVKPSLANYDYAHINFRGGRRLAGLLYETLIYGKEQYERRKTYEAE